MAVQNRHAPANLRRACERADALLFRPGDMDEANLIKLHRFSGKVSYLYYPGYAMFAELTRREEERGLLKEASRIGTREGWEERLREAGVRIEGHEVVESQELRVESQREGGEQ